MCIKKVMQQVAHKITSKGFWKEYDFKILSEIAPKFHVLRCQKFRMTSQNIFKIYSF